MLGLLAAIWGAAFMLIAIGLRGFEPATLIAVRLGSAALALALVEAVRGRLAAAAVRSERVGGLQLAAFVVGGVAIVVATVFYAAGALYVSRRLQALSPLEVSFGLLAWAALFTLPPGLVVLPGSDAGWGPVAAVLALGVVATALAFQLYFGLISGVGASRAILVTYLVPSLALVYGILLLDEPFRWTAIGGLALVLAGVAVGTGAVRRRVAAPA
jgi:drug/metabolite transporter (DMT)-like permease